MNVWSVIFLFSGNKWSLVQFYLFWNRKSVMKFLQTWEPELHQKKNPRISAKQTDVLLKLKEMKNWNTHWRRDDTEKSTQWCWIKTGVCCPTWRFKKKKKSAAYNCFQNLWMLICCGSPFLLYISKTLFYCARKVTAFFLFSIKLHHFRSDTPWKFQMEDSDKPLFSSHWVSQIKSKPSFPEKTNYVGHFPLGCVHSVCDDIVTNII